VNALDGAVTDGAAIVPCDRRSHRNGLERCFLAGWHGRVSWVDGSRTDSSTMRAILRWTALRKRRAFVLSRIRRETSTLS
jgi:hypothetical protein